MSTARWDQRGRFEIYRRSLRDPMPKINIPLAGDAPPLREEDQAWSAELIRAAADQAPAK